MPTIDENRLSWDVHHDWSRGGNEWSTAWGGVDMQWYGTLLPRLHRYVPAHSILEIAPGFGRWTHYLKALCDNLIVVDLSEKCIEACRQRFEQEKHIRYHVNDGISLDMVADRSVDLVFSFDSLVHAESDVIKGYLAQIKRKLTDNGVSFLHHSNIGAYAAYFRLIRHIPKGKNPLVRLGLIEPMDHWRAYSMTAKKFRRFAEEAGLACVSQELVNWGTTHPLIDCISVCTLKNSIHARPNRIFKNRNFMREVTRLKRLGELYGEEAAPPKSRGQG